MSTMTAEMSLVLNITMLHTRVQKIIEQHLYVHGISFTEFMVMHYLHDAPKESMRRIDLARHIGLSASGVTRLLMPMQKIGLVEKEVNPRDARVSLVKLTQSGKTIYADALTSFEYGASSLTQKLSAKQLAEFTRMTEIPL